MDVTVLKRWETLVCFQGCNYIARTCMALKVYAPVCAGTGRDFKLSVVISSIWISVQLD